MDGDGSSGLRISVIVFCLAISFFSSGAETAYFTLSPVRLRQLLESGRKHAERIIALKSRPDLLLGTVLLSNTIVNIVATSMVSAFFPVTEAGQFIASLVATLLLLIFGEVTPKSIAAHDPEQFAFSVVVPMQAMIRLLMPLVRLMNLLNPAPREDQRQSSEQARQRILLAASLGEQSGELEQEENRMIRQILTISDQPASLFMHSLEQAVTLAPGTTLGEAVRISKLSGYSRFPVFEEGYPMGLLLIQDLMMPLHQGHSQQAIRPYLRPIARYYEEKPVGQLLHEMRRHREQLVLICTPQGRLSGFLSIEDLIEQVIGDISDEYDRSVPTTEGGVME